MNVQQKVPFYVEFETLKKADHIDKFKNSEYLEYIIQYIKIWMEINYYIHFPNSSFLSQNMYTPFLLTRLEPSLTNFSTLFLTKKNSAIQTQRLEFFMHQDAGVWIHKPTYHPICLFMFSQTILAKNGI